LYIGLHQNGDLTFQNEVSEHFKIPLTTLNYHITKFQDEGLIEEMHGLNLTDDGKKLFKYMWENTGKKELRAHNIQIMFRVIICPKHFPECFSKSIYQFFSNGKYRGIKTELKNMIVMFYSPRKIVCVLRDIYGNTDEEISGAVMLLIPEIYKILEKEFEGIKIDGYEIGIIQKMHIAILNSIIAEKYLLKGSTEENKEFAIDNSNGIKELELTEPSTALRDIMELLGLEEDFKKFLEWRKRKEL
jgi:hypothetical protein